MPVPHRAVLEMHLRSNHIPPIPVAFADAAAAAIEAIEADEPDRLIHYGKGLAANGRAADRACDIADAMHLWSMIEETEWTLPDDEDGLG
jgi:hypothetical protein